MLKFIFLLFCLKLEAANETKEENKISSNEIKLQRNAEILDLNKSQSLDQLQQIISSIDEKQSVKLCPCHLSPLNPNRVSLDNMIIFKKFSRINGLL